MASKIRKGDKVIVLTGKSKGKNGVVNKVITDTNKVLVDGVNLYKKHQKPNPNANIEGGIISKEMPIHISNVALFNPKTEKADRIGFKLSDEGKKVRFFKSNGELVDVQS